MPHGGHQYGIVRECSETRIPGCNGRENSLLMFKDCWTECASSGCNNQTDVFELFQPETDPVESCKTCSYIEYSNGTVDGDVKCSTQNDAEVNPKNHARYLRQLHVILERQQLKLRMTPTLVLFC